MSEPRPIIGKAKFLNSGEWFEGCEYDARNGWLIQDIIDTSDNYIGSFPSAIKPGTFCRATGLWERGVGTHKQIFHGDLITIEDVDFLVEIDDDDIMFRYYRNGNVDMNAGMFRGLLREINESMEDIEIICVKGNIHDRTRSKGLKYHGGSK